MHIWTDQAYESMWSHLAFLCHESNARSLLCGGLGAKRPPYPVPAEKLDLKARQLAYCVLQATEYYRAANAVSVHTSPLLYYYGMLSLAKALAVANEPSVGLEDIKNHGLRSHKENASEKLEDQLAVTRDKGVFWYLARVVLGFQYPDGAILKLKDLLSISPELSEMYERYFGEPSKCISKYDAQVVSKVPYRLQVSTRAADAQQVYSRLPELAEDFELSPSPRYSGVLTFTSKDSVTNEPEYFKLYRPVAGSENFVGALPYRIDDRVEKHYLSPFVSDYVSMFILSDCVRYRQDLWGEVVHGKETGILGLITLFLSVSKRRFPNFILDQLFGERFTFGAPAYIS